MKNTFTVKGATFVVSAILHAEGVKFPNSDKKDNTLHNQFKITIKTPLGRATFDFYGSHQDYTNGQTEMNESELKHALYCFVSDACSAKNSFEDFCSEFGYDEDSRKAEKIYKACEKSLSQYNRICEADIYDIVNELND